MTAQRFPTYEFQREPPYTVVTDGNYFRVKKSVRVLWRLHDDFTELFEPLVTRPEGGVGIQLVFFESEQEYDQYANQYAPQLENSSGFYSPKLDQLIAFNQITSTHLKRAKRKPAWQERLHRRNATTPEDKARLELWREDSWRSIQRYAERKTIYTLRHEGAHQLFL